MKKSALQAHKEAMAAFNLIKPAKAAAFKNRTAKSEQKLACTIANYERLYAEWENIIRERGLDLPKDKLGY